LAVNLKPCNQAVTPSIAVVAVPVPKLFPPGHKIVTYLPQHRLQPCC